MNTIKKNRVWSEVVQEQTLCETISKISGLEANDSKVKREVESYDVQKYEKNETRKRKSKNKKKKRLNKQLKTKSTLEKLSLNVLNQIKNEYLENKNVEFNQDDSCLNIRFDETKDRSYIKASEFDSDEIVCMEIVRQLNEKKNDLISILLEKLFYFLLMHIIFKVRSVKTLGRKKVLELLYATHDIDENGGMYTEVKNN